MQVFSLTMQLLCIKTFHPSQPSQPSVIPPRDSFEISNSRKLYSRQLKLLCAIPSVCQPIHCYLQSSTPQDRPLGKSVPQDPLVRVPQVMYWSFRSMMQTQQLIWNVGREQWRSRMDFTPRTQFVVFVDMWLWIGNGRIETALVC